jgi:hypothetical protein
MAESDANPIFTMCLYGACKADRLKGTKYCAVHVPADEPFYMVAVAKRTAPTQKHYDLEEAKTEAVRLAQANHGYAVHVLKVVATCQLPPSNVIWQDFK